MTAKVGFFGPMKGLDSARHEIEVLADGRVRATIEHETMRGVTVAMLRWWFENIDTMTKWNGMSFDGPEVPVYRYWHPFDHIRTQWLHKVPSADGRLGPGSEIRIEENLGGKHPVRETARVTRFDDQAFNFEVRMLGTIRAVELDHEYAPVDGGCSFVTRLTAGTTLPVLKALGPSVDQRRQLAQAWVLHNIEESGETEKFVPVLFEQAQNAGY